MDINEALDRLNDYSPKRLFTLSEQKYWFYELKCVELCKTIPDPPVTIMSGSTQLVTIFILGMIAGIKQNQEDGD